MIRAALIFAAGCFAGSAGTLIAAGLAAVLGDHHDELRPVHRALLDHEDTPTAYRRRLAEDRWRDQFEVER